MSGYESYSKAATKQANFENRKLREQEPRKREHKNQEFPDVDTFQRYLKLQQESEDE